MDILCQAKSGMGKTAVFVLATLQQLEPVDGQVCFRRAIHDSSGEWSDIYERASVYMYMRDS